MNATWGEYMMKLRVLASILAISCSFAANTVATSAYAAESGALPYQPGSSGDFIGVLPYIPGLFMQENLSYSNSYALVGDDGKTIPGSDLDLNVTTSTSRFLFSWGSIGDLHLYSQIIVPVVHGDTTVKFGGFTAADGSKTGFGNIFFGPIIGKYDFDEYNSITFGYDYASKLGNYSATDAFSPAVGYASHQPTFGFTHAGKDGFYFAALARGIFNETNDTTHYRTGNAINVDFRSGWQSGNWRAGVVGGFYDQFQSDSGDGAVNGKTRLLSIGPSISYDFGGPILNFNFKTTPIARNTTKSNSFWVSLAVPLWMPKPPSEADR
ncbi:SphA family protein [Rhizobium sullae]|nr:transporter [Rhizobium sullae]